MGPKNNIPALVYGMSCNKHLGGRLLSKIHVKFHVSYQGFPNIASDGLC